MPVMTIGINNLKEDMATMKAMLERLVKENEENKACIKLYKERIARLTTKLEKQLARSLTKCSESEDEERVFFQSEAFDEDIHSKKGGKLKHGGSLSLMTVEQIQDLIINPVKTQLGEVHTRLTSTVRGLMRSACPVATNLQNSNNSTGRATRNNMWHVSSRHVIMLVQMVT